MRVIIYGLGDKYHRFFDNDEFVKKGIIENQMEIVGFSDSNKKVWGQEIIYWGRKFKVKNIDEFMIDKVDGIIITTEIYFDEIKGKLMGKGYKDEQILLINQLFEIYLNKIYDIRRFKNRAGIEIGGPSDLFCNIYDNCKSCDNVNFSQHTVWGENESTNFIVKDRALGSVFIVDATEMHQIENRTYDFVLSSNNLEHIANPLKALMEFSRIVKTKGTVLVIVPRKEKTFDHNREYTTFKHILEDYINNVGEDDLSHLPDIIEKHDYNMDILCGGKQKFIERAMKNIENRCLHQHVFEEECLKRMFDFAGLEVVEFLPVMNNWLIIGERR